MTKDQDIVYTAGKIIVLWRLVYFTSQYSDLSVKDLSSMIATSGTLAGSAPFDDAVRLGKYCKFIEIRDGKILLTDSCQVALLPLCSSKDPNLLVIRLVLQRIIVLSLYQFHWLLFFNKDTEIFKVSIPQEWLDMLEQAELFNFSQQEVEDWWNAILQSVNDFDLSTTKEIGDVGEKLTINYETTRLLSDGISKPHQYVKWVSRFSDNYGYDIVSINGKRQYKRRVDLSVSQIEVKATVGTSAEKFRFKMSRNEWNTALRNSDTYYFYCWLGININNHTATDGPYIIPAKKFVSMVPKDRNDACEWTECRLTIDLKTYSI